MYRTPMVGHPGVLFVFTVLLMYLAAQAGVWLRKRRSLSDDERQDLGVEQAATLTLLGLIIGFTFSMAVSRYDLRKSREAEEANAIGTEYVRVGMLPAADAAALRPRLKRYIDLRVRFYNTRDDRELEEVNAETLQLQSELWAVVEARAQTQPTPIVALAVAGMNDVLNSQAYTQAAWWNRIPGSAWILMIFIAVCANLLVGFGAKSDRAGRLLVALPMVIAVSLLLIADIDSPRRGFINVLPQNLNSLAQSLANN
jgi:hypothetical protein